MAENPQQYASILKGLGSSTTGLSKYLSGLGYNTSGANLAGTGLGAAGNAASLIGDVQQGGVQGDVGAAGSLARLGTTNWGQSGSALSHLGFDPSQVKGVNMGATGALDALAMYNGIKQGGVTGYGQAVGAGLQGAGMALGNAALSTAGGYVLAPLAVYNAIKNWKSGSTGSDALQGAEAGAAVGSVVPVVGTAIGAVIGGAAGALSSAFGGGSDSQEATYAQGYTNAYDKYNSDPNIQKQLAAMQTPSSNIQYLQGLMNAHTGTAGHESDLQAAFGKNNVAGLTTGMTQQINQAIQNGQIAPDASPDEIYSKVVAPWLSQKSNGIGGGADAVNVKGDVTGGAEQAALTNLISQWEGGQLTGTTPVGVKGQTISGLQAFNNAGKSSPYQTVAAPTAGGVSNPNDPAVLAAQKANSALAMKGMPPQQATAMSSGPVLDPATNYTTVMQGPNSTGAGALATISAANRAQSPQSAAAYDKMASPQTQPAPSMAYNPGPGVGIMQAPEFGLGHSEGGSMKKRKKSALDHLYRGNFKERAQHYDDGGGVDYVSGPSASDYIDTSSMPDYEEFVRENPYSPPGGISQPPPSGGGPSFDPSLAGQLEGLSPSQLAALQASAGDMGTGSSGKGGFSKDLANLKANVSGDNGVQGWLNILKGISPLAAAIVNKGKGANQKAPSAVPGMTQGASNPHAPLFNRSAVQNPSNNATGSPMSMQDWYTYGSRPEAAFFNNNQVPLAQSTGVAQGQAHGGQAGHGSALDALNPEMPGEFDSAQENYVQGPGDGTSDDIPAKLSDGEYVMDANTVSMLGNGSNKAGAERLDALRQNLRKHAAAPMKKGKQFMKAKAPAAYMGGRQGKK